MQSKWISLGIIFYQTLQHWNSVSKNINTSSKISTAHQWVECSPVVWETGVQSRVASYQRLKKCYLILPCLTFSNIRYVSRVKWSNPGKGVAPSPIPRCSSYWKGSLLVANFTTYFEQCRVWWWITPHNIEFDSSMFHLESWYFWFRKNNLCVCVYIYNVIYRQTV